MKIFYCKDRFEDMMTCIYDAWEQALIDGHDNVRVMKEPIYQQTLFAEYIYVEASYEKFQKVVRSIKKSISFEAYLYIYYASLSNEEDALQAIYNFLRIGFANGSAVVNMYANQHVMRIFELKRKVGNECQFFREFSRFTSINNIVYVCHIEPKCNVAAVVAKHFEDRMPSEHWMIIDDNRKYAVVHPKDEESYIRYLEEDELGKLRLSEQRVDEYTDMWKSFFKAISIKERESRERQRNMIPIWMRKHATEFMK